MAKEKRVIRRQDGVLQRYTVGMNTEAEVTLETSDPLDAHFPTPAQKLDAIAELAKKTMDQHGLTSWSFRFDGGTTRLGATNHSGREITMGRAPAQVNTAAEIRETLMHEIAHALVGKHHGHNEVWKRKAAELGAKPQRIADPTEYNKLRAKRNQEIRDRNRPDPSVRAWTVVQFRSPRGTLMSGPVEGIEQYAYRVRIEGVILVSVPCSKAQIVP